MCAHFLNVLKPGLFSRLFSKRFSVPARNRAKFERCLQMIQPMTRKARKVFPARHHHLKKKQGYKRQTQPKCNGCNRNIFGQIEGKDPNK